ncbi:glycosyltransferase family 2 protein [uncultured Bacteroides sp.]|uniref:glycosyltransferase family 2 protein n=1 Tax=uncultured Bacteroides sp. TaxID=162156 RepID=UPI0025F7E878|nr:glycosyltransferase family 2 protein [uncultured Bacteroides sp.]
MDNNIINNPKVSVVTICYNSVQFIEKTIQSVLSQTYPNVEYIVIDGGSTDGTKEIIEKYSSRITYWCSEKDGGIYDAMNKGIKKATGEWINFMNSGDSFVSANVLTDVMSEQIEDDICVVYCDAIYDYGDHEEKFICNGLKNITYKMVFCHQSCLIRTSIHKERPFSLKYKIAGDYDFFYNLYFDKGEQAFKHLSVFLAKEDMTDSLSRNSYFDALRENLKISAAHKNLRWYRDKLRFIIKDLIRWEKNKNTYIKILRLGR